MNEQYIHINRPNITGYLPRVRYPGCRHYKLLKKRKTRLAALVALAKEFAKEYYKRGDVLMLQEGSYYDPTVLDEIVKHG